MRRMDTGADSTTQGILRKLENLKIKFRHTYHTTSSKIDQILSQPKISYSIKATRRQKIEKEKPRSIITR